MESKLDWKLSGTCHNMSIFVFGRNGYGAFSELMPFGCVFVITEQV